LKLADSNSGSISFHLATSPGQPLGHLLDHILPFRIFAGSISFHLATSPGQPLGHLLDHILPFRIIHPFRIFDGPILPFRTIDGSYSSI